MSLGLCVRVRDRQDSICVRFARAGLYCVGQPLLCWIAGPAAFCLGCALLACIALSDGCQMHDLQPSSRARRMYRRLSLSSTHCITLLPLSGGILIARSLSIFDLNLATGAGVVPRVAAL